MGALQTFKCALAIEGVLCILGENEVMIYPFFTLSIFGVGEILKLALFFLPV